MIQITLTNEDLQDQALGARIAALFGLTPASITETCGDLSRTVSGPTLEELNRAVKATAAHIDSITRENVDVLSDPAKLAVALKELTAGDAGTFQAAEQAPIIPVPTPTFIPPIPGAGEGDAPLVDLAIFGAGVAQPSTAPVVPLPTSVVQTGSEVPALPPGVAAGAQAGNAAPSNPASGVEVDKDGLPWDGRIHSESKAKNKDGTWRARRNLPDGVAATVTAELRSLAGIPPATPTGDLPPLPDATVSPPVVTATAVTPFNQMLRSITPHLRSEANPSGKLVQTDITEGARKLGLIDANGTGQFMLLAHREDLLPQFIAHINECLLRP